MSSSRATAVANRLASFAASEPRRPRVVDLDLDARVLVFLAGRTDGSASFGRLSLEFMGVQLSDSLDRLESKKHIERFPGCEFHVTHAGRMRAANK